MLKSALAEMWSRPALGQEQNANVQEVTGTRNAAPCMDTTALSAIMAFG